jgi:dolichyl-phosphate-mannose--protein O-mannosyl transferase
MPVIWIFICTDVWNKLCEKHNNVHAILKQVCVYIMTVGVLPFIVYCSIFKFHFVLLPNAGDHDLLVSSRLRYSLQGNALEPSQPSKEDIRR